MRQRFRGGVLDPQASTRAELRAKLQAAAAQLREFTALPVVHRVLARIDELEAQLRDPTLPWSAERLHGSLLAHQFGGADAEPWPHIPHRSA